MLGKYLSVFFKSDEYTCARCGKTYKKGRPDDEAMKETKEQFGEDVDIKDCDVICDDCYNVIMKQ